jgi:hypothetical protein
MMLPVRVPVVGRADALGEAVVGETEVADGEADDEDGDLDLLWEGLGECEYDIEADGVADGDLDLLRVGDGEWE